MSNIEFKIISYLGRTPDFLDEVKLRDKGDGKIFIEEWNAKDKTKPTDSQLNALETEATKLLNNEKADSKRRKEYLPFEDQLEMIYKDQKNGTTTYKDHCDKVRSDNPKE